MTLEEKIRSTSDLSDLVELYSSVVKHLIKEIKENPHDATLGEKLRKYGVSYLDVYKKGK